MPASILFGHTFQTVVDDRGAVCDIIPISGSYEFVGRAKLRATIELCDKQGIPIAMWPVYDVGVAARVPLKEALSASKNVSDKLLAMRNNELIRDNEVLGLIISYLEESCLFFVVM